MYIRAAERMRDTALLPLIGFSAGLSLPRLIAGVTRAWKLRHNLRKL